MRRIIFLFPLFFLFSACNRQINETDRIYTNVYIHGVAVGGMNRAESEVALAERFTSQLELRTVRYMKNGEIVAEYLFGQFGARFDFTLLIDDALKPRRGVARFFRRELNTSPIFVYNAEKLEDIMKELSQKLDVSPQNAVFYADSAGKISVTPERVGEGINIEVAAAATQEILISLEGGDIELEFAPIPPLYTSAAFDFSPEILGSFHTHIASTGSSPRVRNINRAVDRINNSVVFPGETFSAGTVIAANLPESGYESAIVLVQGKAVEDIGGGVCQVVTTLYNAALHAELAILQRHNHSARVSYVDVGFDATVAGDYFDLKFQNTSPHPILITSRVSGGNLYVQIHGHETREANRKLRFEASTDIIPPEPYREVVDPAIPRGERLVTLESQMGYHVELYKIIYVGGMEIAREKINTSVYKPTRGIIAIGAG